MKKIYFILALLLSIIVVVNCSKDDKDSDTTAPAPTTSTCKVDSFTETENGNIQRTTKLYYDNSDRIVKVTRQDSGEIQPNSFDTVYYNNDGEIVKIERYGYSKSTLYDTYTYTYTSGKITQILEEGTYDTIPYTITHTLSYTGSNLTSVSSTGNPYGNDMGFSNITYSNGNIATLELDMMGDGSNLKTLTVVCDNKHNVYKKYLPYPDYLVEYFSNNNLLTATMQDTMQMEDTVLAVGTVILDRSYTYNSYNEVLTVDEEPSPFNDDPDSRGMSFIWKDCE